MSQNFNLSALTAFKFNGADCAKVMLNGVRIWERYTAQRQVWVASGYNQTTFQKIGEATPSNRHGAAPAAGFWYYKDDFFAVGWHDFYYSRNNARRSYKITTHWVGTRRYSRGAYRFTTGRETRWHTLIIHDNVTTWVDTSSYQTQNYTAYYY
jgi:hypothetical protein